MTKEFILPSRNKIIVRIGEIEVQTGDAIMNWASIHMNSGPDSFYRTTVSHRQYLLKKNHQLSQQTVLTQGTASTRWHLK